MTIECDTTSLQNLRIFNKVDAKRLRLVAMMAERLHYKAGERLASEGDFPETIYIVVSGEIELSRSTPCGHLYALSLGAGTLLGDVPMLCQKPYIANATAKTQVVALSLGKDLFFELLAGVPDFAVAVSRDIASRLYHVTTRLFESELQHGQECD